MPDDPVPRLLRPVLEALVDTETRFVVVGGVAVVLHGHARLTMDLDLVIDLGPGKAIAAIDALVAIGLRPRVPVEPRDFADPDIRRGWIEERNMQAFPLEDPNDPRRHVDVFVESPVDFEELWRDSVVKDLGGGLAVRVASIPHLQSMKRAAGRTWDMDDIQALELIRRHTGADDDH